MLDPHPQRLTLLRPPCVQRRLHSLQNLTNIRSIILPPQDLPRAAAALLEPQLNNVDNLVGDIAPIAALERRLVVVEHALQHTEERLERHADVDARVHHPRLRADSVLVLEGVALEDGHHVGDGEHGLGEVEARAEGAHSFADGLVGLRLAARDGLFVGLFE